MAEIPTELQWDRLCSLVSALSVTRRYICRMEIIGGFLYVITQSCDADNLQTYILDSDGELL
jgi:hypothetical protein